MRYIFSVLVFSLSLYSSLSGGENKLVPYFANGLWGFADINHKIIVSPKYDRIDDFSDGRAWVMKDDKCGFIDEFGNEIIPLKFSSADNFRASHSVVGIDDKYGVIDLNGKFVVPLADNYISYFDGEVGKFSVDYIYGLIGKTGKVIVPAEYPKLDEFGNYHYIFSKYENPEDYKLGKMGIMNSRGEIIIPATYDIIYPITNSIAKIKQGNSWGLIDTSGIVIIPAQYQEIRNPKSSAVVGFKQNGLWGIMKFDGTILVEPKYHDLGQGNSFFDEAFAKMDIGFKVVLDGLNGTINENGNEIIPIRYFMLLSSSFFL